MAADARSQPLPGPAYWDVVGGWVGGGAAGLMTCLDFPFGLRVFVESARTGDRSRPARWAAGGLAAVTRRQNSFTSHRQTRPSRLAGLWGDPKAVELARSSRRRPVWKRLLQLGHGVSIAATWRSESPPWRPPTATCGAWMPRTGTGGALVDALEREAQAAPPLLERARACWPLNSGSNGAAGQGLQVLDGLQGALAAGPGPWLPRQRRRRPLFRENHQTRPRPPGDGVGDGLAKPAPRCAILEFVQFHRPPDAAGAPHFLISEAGEGRGRPAGGTSGQSPVAQLAGGDLALGDQVSRALVRTMQESKSGTALGSICGRRRRATGTAVSPPSWGAAGSLPWKPTPHADPD